MTTVCLSMSAASRPRAFLGDVLRVARESCGATAGAADRLWHHQIHFDVGGRAVDVARHDPCADAIAAREPRGGHRRCDFGRLLQQGGVECEIGVSRERGDRQFDGTSVQVDRLRADQDHRLSLCPERVEGIEEDAAGDDVPVDQVRQTCSLARIHSISASPSFGPRPGLVSRSTATWLSAATVTPFFCEVRSYTIGSSGVPSATFAPASVGRKSRSRASASGSSA